MAQTQAPDFGDTTVQGQIAPAVVQQSPVTDNSGQYLAKAVDSAATGIGTIGADIFKGAITGQNNSILADYRQKVTTIANAASQGLSPQAAQLQARTLYSQFIGNHPALAGDIDKINSSLLGDNGLAHVVYTGNDQAQAQTALAKDAISKGWQNSDGSADVSGYQHFQQTVTSADYQLKQIQLKSAQLGAITDADKATAHTAIMSIAKAGTPWIQQQFQQGTQLLAGVTDPAQRAAIIQKVQGDVLGATSQISTQSDGEDVSYIVKPMQDQLQAWVDLANGKTTTDAYTAQSAQTEAKLTSMFMSDPDIARTITISKLFGQNASLLNTTAMSQAATKAFAMNNGTYDPSSTTPQPAPATVVGQTPGIDQYFTLLKGNMNSALTNPTGDPVAISKEVSNQMTNVFRGMTLNNAESVKDYRSTVNFLASSEVQKWTASGKLIVPKVLSDKVTAVMQDNYENVLLPVVESSWTTPTITIQSGPLAAQAALDPTSTANHVSPSQVVDPVWDGTSVVFKPKPEYSKNPSVIGLANNLNSGPNAIAGPLNTYIRAKAAIQGNTDYSSIYKDLGDRLFNPQDAVKPSTGKDNLSEFEVTPQKSLEVSSIEDRNNPGMEKQDELPANYMKIGSRFGDPYSSEWASQNLTTIQSPTGQSVTVNKQAAPAFQGFLSDLKAEGYNAKEVEGYNLRPIRGSSTISQHAFGNAIDINPGDNPMGNSGKQNLPANIASIAAKWGLKWGGSFSSRKDPMHFEWTGNTPSEVNDNSL